MRTFFRNTIIMKICTYFAIVRFDFDFLIFLTIHQLTINITLYYIVDFTLQFVACFQQFLIVNQKILTFSFIKTFNTSTRFWKHYTKWFDFIIIFVSNEVFKTFFTIRNFVRNYYFTNIQLTYINWILKFVKCILFNLNITKT